MLITTCVSNHRRQITKTIKCLQQSHFSIGLVRKRMQIRVSRLCFIVSRGLCLQRERCWTWEWGGGATWEIKTVIRYQWVLFLSLCNNRMWTEGSEGKAWSSAQKMRAVIGLLAVHMAGGTRLTNWTALGNLHGWKSGLFSVLRKSKSDVYRKERKYHFTKFAHG